MAHGDYDCCAVCDRKMGYSTSPNTKEDLCAECAVALMENGVRATSAQDVLAWVKQESPATVRHVLERVGYKECYYGNDFDVAVADCLESAPSSTVNGPTLCLDFDGVLHSYTSGWQGVDVVADPPVAGAMQFLRAAVQEFQVCIVSSRSKESAGIAAMQDWLKVNLWQEVPDDAQAVWDALSWPREKPPAHVTLDDRAITFDGTWPSLETIRDFKPWNRK